MTLLDLLPLAGLMAAWLGWAVWLGRRQHRKRFYRSYINSPAWRAKREEYRAARPWECARCGATVRLELHHRTYRRLGRERLDDLVPLCRPHHEAQHSRPPVQARGHRPAAYSPFVAEDSAGEDTTD